MTKTYIGTKEVTAWPQERDGAPGYAVRYADGYTSWSPRAVFEEAYRATEGEGQQLTFGDALHLMWQGARVARAGWNGKGMYLQLVRNYSAAIGAMPPDFRYLPWIGMKTADNGFVPWLASQTDALARDWRVLCLVNDVRQHAEDPGYPTESEGGEPN
jgi:hypothetical protein